MQKHIGGTPRETRTLDTGIRNPMLCPIELSRQIWLRRRDSNPRPSDNESGELATAPLRNIETVLIWRSVTPAVYICLFGHINGTALCMQYIKCSLVRMTGLEPAASSAQTTRSLKLSYIRIY